VCHGPPEKPPVPSHFLIRIAPDKYFPREQMSECGIEKTLTCPRSHGRDLLAEMGLEFGNPDSISIYLVSKSWHSCLT
jgi:hypothetical protein